MQTIIFTWRKLTHFIKGKDYKYYKPRITEIVNKTINTGQLAKVIKYNYKYINFLKKSTLHTQLIQ